MGLKSRESERPATTLRCTRILWGSLMLNSAQIQPRPGWRYLCLAFSFFCVDLRLRSTLCLKSCERLMMDFYLFLWLNLLLLDNIECKNFGVTSRRCTQCFKSAILSKPVFSANSSVGRASD